MIGKHGSRPSASLARDPLETLNSRPERPNLLSPHWLLSSALVPTQNSQFTSPNCINSFRSNCPFPHAAKLASMKRKFARLSARATPPAPAAPWILANQLAPRTDAETPGRIDSDSVRDENQTGSNPIKVNPSQSDRIKPQKIKKSAHALRSTSIQDFPPLPE